MSDQYTTNREAHRAGFWEGALVFGSIMFFIMIGYSMIWQHKAEQKCKAGSLHSYSAADGV